MHDVRIILLSTATLLGVLVGGCAQDKKPAASPTQTTSATVTTSTTSTQTERERNEAQALLAQEKATCANDRQQHEAESAVRRQYDELEVRTLDAIEKAGKETLILHQMAVHAINDKQRQRLETRITEAKAQKAKLLGDLRRLHSTTGIGNMSWEEFRTDTDATIHELDRIYANARAGK